MRTSPRSLPLSTLVFTLLASTAISQQDAIYWADVSGAASSLIRTAHLDGAGEQVISAASHPRGLAIDAWAKRLYWCDLGTGFIRSIGLDGSAPLDVTPISSASAGVAFDDVHRRLYWTDTTPPAIYTSLPDGSARTTVISSGLQYPVAIAVDPIHGKLYWSDLSTQKIRYSNLDGSNQQDLLSIPVVECNGLAIDAFADRVYWTQKSGAIFSSALDGSNPAPLVSGLQGPTCLALDRVHAKLYWTESGAGTGIHSASLDGTGPQLVLPGGSGAPAPCWGIAIDNGSTPSRYCTAKTNSRGCTPEIGFTGFPTIAGPDDFYVTATSVLNNKSGVLLWAGAQANLPFHGGYLCLAAPIVRTPLQNSGGNTGPDDCSGGYSFHFAHAYMSSEFLQVGSTVYAQYWSRDPGYAPPENIGLTDAMRFTIAP